MSNIVVYRPKFATNKVLTSIDTCTLLIDVYDQLETINYKYLFSKIKNIIQEYISDELNTINKNFTDDLLHYSIYICNEILSFIDMQQHNNNGLNNIDDNLKQIRKSIENYYN